MSLKDNHIQELQKIGFTGNFRWLRTLENRAHRAAELYCNNSRYTSANYGRTKQAIEAQVRRSFGGRLPNGFFINSDPRGYALKIDNSVNTLSAKDWGGYGLLAPDFEEYK